MKLTQTTRIRQKLMLGGWFSLADALSMSPPIYRLSERIRELEKSGYRIEHRRAAGKTFEEYKIIGKPAEPRIEIINNVAVMILPKQ